MESIPNEETYKNFAGPEAKNKCYICDKTYLNGKKTFTRMSNLNRHFANIHGKTNFNCDLCGNKFTQKYNLTHHMSVKFAEKDTLTTQD